MTTVRATWWSITAFNEEAQELTAAMEGKQGVPPFVKSIHGGMEKCPTTGKEHFQGAVNTDTIRMSQLKRWLPTAHLEKAKNKDALIKYALKADTAVGEKSSMENKTYMSLGDLLKELIKFRYHHVIMERPNRIKAKEDYYNVSNLYYRARGRYRKDLESPITDPRTARAYVHLCGTLHEMYVEDLAEAEKEAELLGEFTEEDG